MSIVKSWFSLNFGTFFFYHGTFLIFLHSPVFKKFLAAVEKLTNAFWVHKRCFLQFFSLSFFPTNLGILQKSLPHLLFQLFFQDRKSEQIKHFGHGFLLHHQQSSPSATVWPYHSVILNDLHARFLNAFLKDLMIESDKWTNIDS